MHLGLMPFRKWLDSMVLSCCRVAVGAIEIRFRGAIGKRLRPLMKFTPTVLGHVIWQQIGEWWANFTTWSANGIWQNCMNPTFIHTCLIISGFQQTCAFCIFKNFLCHWQSMFIKKPYPAAGMATTTLVTTILMLFARTCFPARSCMASLIPAISWTKINFLVDLRTPRSCWVRFSWFLHSCKLTKPWKIHHFDGICQERCGFSLAMLVSGSVMSFFLSWSTVLKVRTTRKFNSSPLKIGRASKGKDRLPIVIFQGLQGLC